MSKKQKYYVVWKGVSPGVYTSWTDCQLQIKGYDGALFKSFDTKEEGLIQMLADFKNTVKQAGTDYNPSVIANYAYDLVKEYNQFYHDFSILREENEALKVFRLALSQNVGKIVKLAMGLLGIEVPERM